MSETILPAKYIRAIYTVLEKEGLKEEKEVLVQQYTDYRTTSVRQMTEEEARALLGALAPVEQDRGKMIRKVYSYAYRLNMTKMVQGQEKVDLSRLNALVERLSPQHKQLHEHTYSELVILVSLVGKYYYEQLQKGPIL